MEREATVAARKTAERHPKTTSTNKTAASDVTLAPASRCGGVAHGGNLDLRILIYGWEAGLIFLPQSPTGGRPMWFYETRGIPF